MISDFGIVILRMKSIIKFLHTHPNSFQETAAASLCRAFVTSSGLVDGSQTQGATSLQQQRIHTPTSISAMGTGSLGAMVQLSRGDPIHFLPSGDTQPWELMTVKAAALKVGGMQTRGREKERGS